MRVLFLTVALLSCFPLYGNSETRFFGNDIDYEKLNDVSDRFVVTTDESFFKEIERHSNNKTYLTASHTALKFGYGMKARNLRLDERKISTKLFSEYFKENSEKLGYYLIFSKKTKQVILIIRNCGDSFKYSLVHLNKLQKLSNTQNAKPIPIIFYTPIGMLNAYSYDNSGNLIMGKPNSQKAKLKPVSMLIDDHSDKSYRILVNYGQIPVVCFADIKT